jgi:transcription termination/antitermination protein NusA
MTARSLITPEETIGPLMLKEADLLAREKSLALPVVFECLEQAFARVCKSAYGETQDIRAHIDRVTGQITVNRHLSVVDEVEDINTQISSADADMPAGQEIADELPLPNFNRVLIQHFKQALTKTLYEVERELQYEEFKDRVGQVVSGVVKRVEGGNVVVDIGRAEAIIMRSELIPREVYRLNDRVKSYIYSVRREPRGHQIFLSRTHPGFLIRLFSQEVPEIYDGLIEIRAAARDPGSRAKVAVIAVRDERTFDPIGACVGVRGSRVNAVSQELQGEKIDVIPWSPDLPVFVVNALTPAEATKVIVDKPGRIKVVVPDHQQSIAIGRRGQNVKLAHQLTGVDIEITTETAENEFRTQQRQDLARQFIDMLDLDDMMAHLLVSEGFENLEDLVQTSEEEMSLLPGFTREIAAELKMRAQEAIAEQLDQSRSVFMSAGGQKEVEELGVPTLALPALAEHNILSVRDLGDLALDELLDILGDKKDMLTEESWGELILKARA